MNKKLIPLLVTTLHKGVFFGYGRPTQNKTVRLTNAQMCVFWDTATKGVLGLAARGPNANCRIGPAVPAIVLQDVTSVTESSEEAAEKFKQAPWK